ncbi:NifB/NifX family molybdenum-iron cluster-binding protein [bacterium]|nr:NifB/NifX family molybdenum-iron cluster-binding protein [bacterium]
MKERIVIPTIDNGGLNAKVSEHFGRAPYFTVIDLDEDGNVASINTVPNTGEHFGRGGRAKDQILTLNPTAVIVYDMGPRALMSLQEAKVVVLRANAEIVEDIISAFKEDKLEELTEGCHHSAH